MKYLEQIAIAFLKGRGFDINNDKNYLKKEFDENLKIKNEIIRKQTKELEEYKAINLEDYVLPAKEKIELTGTTKPYYNSFLSPSYFKGTKKSHYGVDIVSGMYTAIGNGVVDYVDNSSGGGVVVRHELNENFDLLAIYWHGLPLVKVGAKVDSDTYVTNSKKPYDTIGTMGKHTHFEIRKIPKGHKFKYFDEDRPSQAIDPLKLKARNKKVSIGTKIKSNKIHKGI